MTFFSSFRAKLILTIFPVVAGVLIGALLLAEWKFSATYQRLFEEQFENQITSVNHAKNKRFEALSSVLEKLAQTPATLKAMREGDFTKVTGEMRPALEKLAKERLQSEIGNLPKPPTGGMIQRPGLPGRPDDRREEKGKFALEMLRPQGSSLSQSAPFIALIDHKGEFVRSQRQRSGSPVTEQEVSRRSPKIPWLGDSNFDETLKQQEVGYLIVEAGDKRGEQVREVFVTPMRDPNDGKFLGAIVFGLPMISLADRVLYEQSKRSEYGEIMSGIYVEEKLVSATVPEDQREAVAAAVARSLNQSHREKRELILPIDGVRHRLIYRVLNPESPFPQAVQVSFYSLAALDREIGDLRRSAVGLGAAALLVAFVLVMLTSRSLSGPVSQLVIATQKIEQGNFDVRVPVTRNELGRVARAFNDMASGLALQEKYRSVLNAVADRTVAERLIENRDALVGELRDVSILFCDIRGFTALTEKMPPHEVIELLNEHMTALTKLAYDHGGIVDKFVGDLIMVLFGAPVTTGNDTLRAVECAQAMIRIRRELNHTSRHPLEIGIGIATGSVVAGCMGSDQRLSYTVLGHRVNLASRLCGIAQAGEIVCDEETATALGEAVATTPLPPRQLKGFSEPMAIRKVN